MKPICLITGVGPGTGTAIARRFSSDYEVNTLALLQLGQELVPSMIDKGKGAIVCTGNDSKTSRMTSSAIRLISQNMSGRSSTSLNLPGHLKALSGLSVRPGKLA